MTDYARPVSTTPRSVVAPRASRRSVARRAGSSVARSLSGDETSYLVLLIAFAVVSMVIGVLLSDFWPVTAAVIPILLGINVLSSRSMLVLVFVVVICLVFQLQAIGDDMPPARWGGVGVVGVVAVIALWSTHRRATLGVASSRGESMLIDLRDRLAAQGQLPALPSKWHAEAVIRSAGGASFAGDFIVAAKTERGRRLEIVLVDVSGKGLNAGTRALLLSGAFGGLLGSLRPEVFLDAANDYLLRQEWGEGFATAIHLLVHLDTGDYEVRTAGHPPAVHFHAGSGRWTVHWTEGPILGLVGDAAYSVHRGLLRSGDALMLYTDGLVETPRRDLTYGIDKLLGEAERLVQHGFVHGAERLVRMVGSDNDDRALLMLHRR